MPSHYASHGNTHGAAPAEHESAVLDFLGRALGEQKETGSISMRLNHIHVAVRDLPAALAWLDKVWGAQATFKNERMASVPLDPIILILEASDHDLQTTIGFESEDCDRDFRRLVERGAVADSEPSNKPWGARTAYLKGPGALKFEIESPIK